MNAKDCGLPQSRPRIYIVGLLTSIMDLIGHKTLEKPQIMPAVPLRDVVENSFS